MHIAFERVRCKTSPTMWGTGNKNSLVSLYIFQTQSEKDDD